MRDFSWGPGLGASPSGVEKSGRPWSGTFRKARPCRRVLMLPDLERAERIGEFWSYPQSRSFAELLIDYEEDRTLTAVLVGMLRDIARSR
jgi:hypothetical protein